MAKIFIIDDSDMFRQELRTVLEGAGHDIVEAIDGKDGLRVANESTDIDMVISDFNMPELNGIEMLEQLKQIPAYQNCPTFMLTTETSPDLKLKAREIGVMAWILKPFNAEKLTMGIAKVLAAKK